MNGIDVVFKICEEKNMFIIMLLVKLEDMDKISGLIVGVDDYLIKLFNFFEFIVWVKL